MVCWLFEYFHLFKISDSCKEWKEFEAEWNEKYSSYEKFLKEKKKDQASIEKWRKAAAEYLAELSKYKDLKDLEGKLCVKKYEDYLAGATAWKKETDSLKPTE
jgi:hypothetical protein